MFESFFLGSRKFILMLIIIIVGVVFRIKGLVSGGEMVSLFSSTGVAFMGANSIEYMYASVKTWTESKTVSTASTTPGASDVK